MRAYPVVLIALGAALASCLDAPSDRCADGETCAPAGTGAGTSGSAGASASAGAGGEAAGANAEAGAAGVGPGAGAGGVSAGAAAGAAGATAGAAGASLCPASVATAPFAFEPSAVELPQAGPLVWAVAGDGLVASFHQSDDLVSIRLSTGDAHTLPPPPSGPVHRPSLVVIGDQPETSTLYVIGGAQGFPLRATAHVQAYDMATATWSVLPSLPAPRFLSTAFEHDGKLVLVGGSPQIHRAGQKEVYELDLSLGIDAVWQKLEPMPGPRELAAGIKHGGRYYVLGGAVAWDQALGVTEAAETLVYDIAHDTWDELPPPPTPRAEAGVAVLCGHLWLVGGSTGHPIAAHRVVEALDPVSKTWATMPPLEMRRANPGVYAHEGALRVAGGYSFPSSYLATGEVGRFITP